MTGRDGYAVFFFPSALEALGDAIRPYIQDSPVVGPHVPCDAIDTAGALIEMTLKGRMPGGEDVELELMVPSSMVRMIVSRESGGMFGFGPRTYGAQAAAGSHTRAQNRISAQVVQGDHGDAVWRPRHPGAALVVEAPHTPSACRSAPAAMSISWT